MKADEVAGMEVLKSLTEWREWLTRKRDQNARVLRALEARTRAVSGVLVRYDIRALEHLPDLLGPPYEPDGTVRWRVAPMTLHGRGLGEGIGLLEIRGRDPDKSVKVYEDQIMFISEGGSVEVFDTAGDAESKLVFLTVRPEDTRREGS